jgi:hypothetical protein
MKPRTKEEAIQIDQLPWKPFPDAFSQGGIRWKLLHVSPEAGAWTAIFDCPAGSSFAAHIHNGPIDCEPHSTQIDHVITEDS